MSRRAKRWYAALMIVAVLCGIAAYTAGEYWPELNKVMEAHAKDTIFVMTAEEKSAAKWTLILWRAERPLYLFGLACAVGALVVAVRGQRKAGRGPALTARSQSDPS